MRVSAMVALNTQAQDFEEAWKVCGEILEANESVMFADFNRWHISGVNEIDSNDDMDSELEYSICGEFDIDSDSEEVDLDFMDQVKTPTDILNYCYSKYEAEFSDIAFHPDFSEISQPEIEVLDWFDPADDVLFDEDGFMVME